MKLTQRRIETIRCPAGKKDILVFDDEQRARRSRDGGWRKVLSCPVSARRRKAPHSSRLLLGHIARRREIRRAGDHGRRGQGLRPGDASAQGRKAAHDALTLETLVGQWETLNLADSANGTPRKPSAPSATPLPASLNASCGSGPSAVVRVLDGLANDGKTAMASRTAAYGRACYHWAVKRGSLSTNPFHIFRSRPWPSGSASRPMTSCWRSGEPRKAGSFNGIVHLILSGQRREEIAGMTWGEIAPISRHGPSRPAERRTASSTSSPCRHKRRAILRAAPRRDETDLVFPGLQDRSTVSRRRRRLWTRRVASRIGACTICVARLRLACRSSASASK